MTKVQLRKVEAMFKKLFSQLNTTDVREAQDDQIVMNECIDDTVASIKKSLLKVTISFSVIS